MRNCLPVMPVSTASLRPVHHSAGHAVQYASNTDGSAGHSIPTSRVEMTASLQKSPKQSPAYLPAAAIFPTITDIARFSINSTGHPPLAVPFLVAGPPPVEQGIRGRQIFGTLAMTSVPQPSSSLSSIVLPAGFVAGPAVRLPVAPVQSEVSLVTTTSAVLQSSAVERSPVTSQAVVTDEERIGAPVEQADHHDMSSAVNWKLKMARDHVSNSEFTLRISFLDQELIPYHYLPCCCCCCCCWGDAVEKSPMVDCVNVTQICTQLNPFNSLSLLKSSLKQNLLHETNAPHADSNLFSVKFSDLF